MSDVDVLIKDLKQINVEKLTAEDVSKLIIRGAFPTCEGGKVTGFVDKDEEVLVKFKEELLCKDLNTR